MQKLDNPIIDEIISNFITKEDKQAAIEFFEYLKANKMSVIAKKLIHNKIMYKGKRMGGFGVYNDNVFQLTIQTQWDENFKRLVLTESEAIQNLVKAHGNFTDYKGCGRCINGKCSATHLDIKTPNKELFEFAKRLLALRVEAILNEQVPKCNYIKIEDRGKIIKCAKCKKCNPACRKLKNF